MTHALEDLTRWFWMLARAIRAGRYDPDRAQKVIDHLDTAGTDLIKKRLKTLTENANVKSTGHDQATDRGDETGIR